MIEHIRKQGYFVVDHDPDADTLHVTRQGREGDLRAGRLSGGADFDGSADLARGASHGRKRRAAPLSNLPTMGGSVPLYVIDEDFGIAHDYRADR